LTGGGAIWDTIGFQTHLGVNKSTIFAFLICESVSAADMSVKARLAPFAAGRRDGDELLQCGFKS
jgi:hypothetical protein